jgi:hypothetical protein
MIDARPICANHFEPTVILMSNNNKEQKSPSTAIEKVGEAVDKAFLVTDQLAPFGKAERITAGVCMGIPFFLMIAQKPYEERAWWWFSALALFFLSIPFVITYFARQARLKRKNDGIFLTGVFSLILITLYVLFTQIFHIKSLNSLSIYVTIKDSFIFGLLLMMAVMLFVTNGLVYWNEYKKGSRPGVQWRAYGNVFLGLALAGVLLFPCTRAKVPHFVFAALFFLGCALATVLRSKSSTKHKVADFFLTGIMATGFLIMGGKELLGWSNWFVNLFNIFGAESVGLWVIGIDFILVSLKRIPEEPAKEVRPGTIDPASLSARPA